VREAVGSVAPVQLIVEGTDIADYFTVALHAGIDAVGVTDLTVVYTADFVTEVRV
jgi:hypothetical protein